MGDRGRDVREDLAELDRRDLERGSDPSRARRRYVRNLLSSVWSVWAEALRGLVTHGLGSDLRLGLRLLGTQPVITGVALLALGVGIPTALLVHHALGAFRSPLPVPEGDRVMGSRYWDPQANDPRRSSVLDLVYWREALSSFEASGATRSFRVDHFADDSGAAAVRAAYVTASAFDVLRSRPLEGRAFTVEDQAEGAPDVVMLSEDLWAGRVPRDPEIVGRTVRIGRTPHTVVGVVPSSFRFPGNQDLWLPLRADPNDFAVGEGPQLLVFGRLADGVSADEARVEMDPVTERAGADDPGTPETPAGSSSSPTNRARSTGSRGRRWTPGSSRDWGARSCPDGTSRRPTSRATGLRVSRSSTRASSTGYSAGAPRSGSASGTLRTTRHPRPTTSGSRSSAWSELSGRTPSTRTGTRPSTIPSCRAAPTRQAT